MAGRDAKCYPENIVCQPAVLADRLGTLPFAQRKSRSNSVRIPTKPISGSTSIPHWQWLLAGLALVSCSVMVITTGGCQDKAADDTTEEVAQPETLDESAKRRFDNFVKDFTRRVDNDDPSRVGNDGTGAALEYTQSVAHELLNPANDNAPYRATITVTTKSTVTVVTPPVEKEEPKENINEDPDSRIDLPIGAELDENELATSNGKGPGRPPRDALKILDNDEVDVYKLIYKNDRWELETKPEPQSFIEAAFRIALNRQG